MCPLYLQSFIKLVFIVLGYEAKIGDFTFWGPVPDFDPAFRDEIGDFVAKNETYQGQEEFSGYHFRFARY